MAPIAKEAEATVEAVKEEVNKLAKKKTSVKSTAVPTTETTKSEDSK
jgi:hypothetical protein